MWLSLPLEAAMWRWKVIQALRGSLIEQLRGKHGDRLVNEQIMMQFHAAQWYQDIGPEDLTKVLNGTADELLDNVLKIFVRTRVRMTVRRGLSVLEVPHTDVVNVVLSMRVCLAQVSLLEQSYVPRTDEVLDTIERVLTSTRSFLFVPLNLTSHPNNCMLRNICVSCTIALGNCVGLMCGLRKGSFWTSATLCLVTFHCVHVLLRLFRHSSRLSMGRVLFPPTCRTCNTC